MGYVSFREGSRYTFMSGLSKGVPRIRSMLSAAHCIDWNHMFVYIFCGQDSIPILLNHMSNEKKPGCLGYIGDCTTQICGGYN